MSESGRARRLPVSARRWGARARNAAWFGVVVAVALIAAKVAPGAAASGGCLAEPMPLSLPDGNAGKGAGLTNRGEGFRFRFDDARDARADVAVLTQSVQGVRLLPGDNLSASMSSYLRGKERTILPGASPPTPQILRISPAGEVEVCLAIDPQGVEGERPGQYAGSVGVTGADLAVPSAIPVVVTFRASRLLAIALAAAGVVLGLLVKMFTELAAAERAPNGGPRSVGQYLRGWAFPTALIFGLISGFLGYVEIYDVDPVWGEESTDWLKLFGTCFAFQLASIEGIDLARRLAGGPGA